MKRILILFAHPAIEKSRIHKQLLNSIRNTEGITINNLYENYPDFYIDVVKEQQLLQQHDIIIWQHPFYWYSSPAIIKEWFDLVLQHGFAYGIHGKVLEGKTALSIISTGGSKDVYCKEGRNHFTINQFLIPFEQSAYLCRMEYLPPFVIHGSHTISKDEIVTVSQEYKKLLLDLRDDKINLSNLHELEYLNDLTTQNV